MLATLSVVSLQSARQKARDAKRVSDMRQIATALELYFNDRPQPGYPPATNLALGNGAAACLGQSGFGFSGCPNVYMGAVPTNPTPGGNAYTYTSDGFTYSITFSVEGQTGGLGAGTYTFTQSGVQ